MGMIVLETEWWTMALPPEWWAETEEESVLVGDQDDVGCIEITTLHKEQGDFQDAELREIAAGEAGIERDWENVQLGEFRGLSADFVEEGAAIREWYLACKGLLLFVTYSCDEENRGMDDAAVREILDTLMVAG
jgi:hypothetical protein